MLTRTLSGAPKLSLVLDGVWRADRTSTQGIAAAAPAAPNGAVGAGAVKWEGARGVPGIGGARPASASELAMVIKSEGVQMFVRIVLFGRWRECGQSW